MNTELLPNYGVFFYYHFYVQERAVSASIHVKMLNMFVETVTKLSAKTNQSFVDSF